jgi:hypothetical protein
MVVSIDRQRSLFPIPKPAEFDLNHPQRAVLDWAAFNDGKFAAFPGNLSKQSLRTLIAKGLIKRTDNPPRYVVTALGWAARGRGCNGERLGRPSFMVSMGGCRFGDDES